ncbi:hypothetical protein OF846_003935 [Rhodotorula toruloides]|nr:hypothetical protein OF846_003935 [Rhodotorula toruloides]KAJ8292658.1 hypothetical protein OF846_003935 [Rhodotorula toruloides]
MKHIAEHCGCPYNLQRHQRMLRCNNLQQDSTQDSTASTTRRSATDPSRLICPQLHNPMPLQSQLFAFMEHFEPSSSPASRLCCPRSSVLSSKKACVEARQRLSGVE